LESQHNAYSVRLAISVEPTDIAVLGTVKPRVTVTLLRELMTSEIGLVVDGGEWKHMRFYLWPQDNFRYLDEVTREHARSKVRPRGKLLRIAHEGDLVGVLVLERKAPAGH
jgi:hypothetical protein